MKQRLLTVISFFFCAVAGTNIYGQTGDDPLSFPSLEDNPVWSLEEIPSKGPILYWKIRYEDDTVLCGQRYIKVGNKDRGFSAYIRTDSQKVYLKETSNCSEGECLLYDFSLEVGDTIETCRETYWVEAIDTVTEFGFTQRWFELYGEYNGNSMYDMWVEGVGSTHHLLYPLVGLRTPSSHVYFSVLCLHNNGVQVYEHPVVEFLSDPAVCDGTVYLDEMEKEVGILVFPNPSDNRIKIEVSNRQSLEKAELYTLDGSLIKSFSPKDGALNVSGIPKGIYLLLLETDDQLVRKRVILK